MDKRSTETEQEFDTAEKARILGSGIMAVLSAGKDKIISGFFKLCAFAGNAVKSFLFGDPKATDNFWGDLKKGIEATSYPTSNSQNKSQDDTEEGKKDTQKGKDEKGRNKDGPPETTTETIIENDIERPQTTQQNPMVSLEKMQDINAELIKFGYGCVHIGNDEFRISAINEKGEPEGSLYSVNANAFINTKGSNEPNSLAAALLQIEKAKDENIMHDKQSFDSAIIRSTLQAAIISAELSDADNGQFSQANGTVQTPMGPLTYAVSKGSDKENGDYYVELGGQEYAISHDGDIKQKINDFVSAFAANPPQYSFTIQEREGKEIRVDYERGTPECFVQVIIDGEVKHEDTYLAEESSGTFGKNGATKNLTDLVRDIGRGKSSFVPEWSQHDTEVDKDTTWISPAAVSYTIAGIVNPSMTQTPSADNPDKFFSLIHAGKKNWPGYIDANTAHMGIDFSNGSPRFVSNHGETGYIYASIDSNNATETAKSVEALRRVIIQKDPEEHFHALSPAESKSPIESITENIDSLSKEETNPTIQSIAYGQIAADCSDIIKQQAVIDIPTESARSQDDQVGDAPMSTEEYARCVEELGKSFVIEVNGTHVEDPDDLSLPEPIKESEYPNDDGWEDLAKERMEEFSKTFLAGSGDSHDESEPDIPMSEYSNDDEWEDVVRQRWEDTARERAESFSKMFPIRGGDLYDEGEPDIPVFSDPTEEDFEL